MTQDTSVADLIRDVLVAYDSLTSLGEDVEDEWTYVNDLSTAWRERLDAASAERGDDVADPRVVAAVERLVEEVGSISDPHRAIDWLSTYPQVVLVALGEQP